MKDKYALLIRIDPMVMQKFGYIAKYYGRSKNKQIEFVMRGLIENFEQKNGPIQLSDIAASSQKDRQHRAKTPTHHT